MIAVRAYDPGSSTAWNELVATSKNGTFLFDRGYVDYHADRFRDASLTFHDGGRLLAVLPATRKDGRAVSHAGLTFGGVVCDHRMTISAMLEVFEALVQHLRAQGVTEFIYKAVPHIYHRLPAEEDLYALQRSGAALYRRDLSSALSARERIRPSKGRRYEVAKGKNRKVEVRETGDYAEFMAIERRQLLDRHGVEPVHTADEMILLASRFPASIRLFGAYLAGVMVGGVVIYESAMVAHAQYIAASDDGREVAATDVVLDHLINDVYAGKPYFDFGISTVDDGRVLNAGLARYKESYGGRAITYDHYRISL